MYYLRKNSVCRFGFESWYRALLFNVIPIDTGKNGRFFFLTEHVYCYFSPFLLRPHFLALLARYAYIYTDFQRLIVLSTTWGIVRTGIKPSPVNGAAREILSRRQKHRWLGEMI